MNDYFDHIEQELRRAVRRHAHLPWYVRLRLRHSRALLVILGCLVIGGPAIAAAAGAFQNGTPVGPFVPPIPNAFDGAAIPGSAHLLSLRVPDPAGGPPWVLRAIKTTRGLECLQLGRFANGGIGVLGEDGAFDNDGRFHPLSRNLVEFVFSCGALDGAGHAFVNEVYSGLPASALATATTSAGGCYQARVRIQGKPVPACPRADLRDVFFGLLGPDAVSVSYRTAGGGTASEPTVGPDGAYLIVLKHGAISRNEVGATRLSAGGETGGPTLADYGGASPIITVTYTRDRSCKLAAQLKTEVQATAPWRKALYARFPALAKAVAAELKAINAGLPVPKQARAAIRAIVTSTDYSRFSRAHRYLIPAHRGLPGPTCPAVGYVARKVRLVTRTAVKTPISAHIETAKSICLSPTEVLRPCGATTPANFRRVPAKVAQSYGILVATWTTRVAVTNQDSHYEIYRSSTGAGIKGCGGGTSFGPTDTNFNAGQKVIFTAFVRLKCTGVTHGTVDFVQDTGPAGAIPVPGQSGEGPDIPVGTFNVNVP